MKDAILISMVIAMLALTPALAELTDYQKGVTAGLEVGLFMGELRGMARYSMENLDKFNSYISNFSQFLFNTYGNNETAIAPFRPTPLIPKNLAASSVPIPGAEPRIGEYPASAYYTATGNWPTIIHRDPLGGA
jgi:hypothetical protein